MTPQLREGGLMHRGWAGLSAAVMAIGILLASTGLLLTLTAAPVDAAALSCNGALATASLVPGTREAAPSATARPQLSSGTPSQ